MLDPPSYDHNSGVKAAPEVFKVWALIQIQKDEHGYAGQVQPLQHGLPGYDICAKRTGIDRKSLSVQDSSSAVVDSMLALTGTSHLL
jgi:hypothetical protein